MCCRRQLSWARTLRSGAVRLVLFLSMCLCVAGCGGGGPRLPVTPHVLRDGSGKQLLAKIPEQKSKVEMPVLYITHRDKYGPNGDWPLFGFCRASTGAHCAPLLGFEPRPT